MRLLLVNLMPARFGMRSAAVARKSEGDSAMPVIVGIS